MDTEKKDILILAIESSCDETAAAVVKNGRQVLSNVISSQIDLHKLYGGVVPEIASRKHIEKINQVIEEALENAEVTLDDIDAIGVTYGRGLLVRFLSVWQKQKQSHMRKSYHLLEFIILKGTFLQIILRIWNWNHRSCVLLCLGTYASRMRQGLWNL